MQERKKGGEDSDHRPELERKPQHNQSTTPYCVQQKTPPTQESLSALEGVLSLSESPDQPSLTHDTNQSTPKKQPRHTPGNHQPSLQKVQQREAGGLPSWLVQVHHISQPESLDEGKGWNPRKPRQGPEPAPHGPRHPQKQI